MFIINFLKSLIFPRYMARFKSMSLFIAIAIFFLSSFILAIPQMTNISKSRYELVDKQNAYDLLVFSNLDEDDLTVLRETSFQASKTGLYFDDDFQDNEVYTYDFEVKNIEENIFFRIVFDTYDVTDNTKSPNTQVIEDFDKLVLPENEDKYLLIFYRNSVVYFTPDFSKELDYTKSTLVFSDIAESSEISYYLMDLYIPEINQQISFNTFISCVVFPLLIVLVLWFFLRSSGSSFHFKEAYNIGAIAMLLPLVLFFIVSWFLPKIDIITYFSSVFGIYYLIMMLIINSKRKIA